MGVLEDGHEDGLAVQDQDVQGCLLCGCQAVLGGLEGGHEGVLVDQDVQDVL